MRRVSLLIILATCVALTSFAQPLKAPMLFMSTDFGDNWSKVDAGFPADATVNALAVSGNTVVAGTEAHGIYISVDGLKHWIASNRGLAQNEKINALIEHNGLLFAGTFRNGIYMSEDDGRSWKQSNSGLPVESIRSFYSKGNVLLAGADHGIFRSENDGRSWTLVHLGEQVNSFASMGSTLFAATNRGILRSDNSVKWSTVWSGRRVLAINYNQNDLVAITEVNVQLGADRGNTWIALHPPFDRYTFKLNQVSDMYFISRWKNSFRSLKENRRFKGNGLPDDVPFSKMIETPYGILVAHGFDGC